MLFIAYRLHFHVNSVFGGESVFLGITLEFYILFFKGDEEALAQTASAHPPICPCTTVANSSAQCPVCHSLNLT